MCVAACVAAAVLGGGPAWAARPTPGGGNGGGHGGGSSSTTAGIDVSYPQCEDSLPAGQAFAVVGLNGGLANNLNPCFPEQFAYAVTLPGGTKQPVAQVYLNTADPGNIVGDWPSPDYPGAYGTTSTPVGDCDYATGTSGPGADSPACAYIYGYDMVAGIVTPAESIEGDAPYFARVTGRFLGAQPVWLDVETGNSWQSDTEMNIADLQGMVAAIRASTPPSAYVPVGVYSTAFQWQQITGTPTGAAAGDLAGPAWIAGAREESDAQANCSPANAFTGGSVVLAQWFAHPYDQDLSCAG